MQTFIIFSGFISLIFGIALILFPNVLKKLSEFADRIVSSADQSVVRYRIGIGLSCILISAFLWFIAYYLKVIPLLRDLNS